MLIRTIARRAVPAAAGGVEQQPPVGETPFRPRSPATKAIFLAVLGSWFGHARERNSIDVPPAFPKAAGTPMRRTVATEWLGRAVIHHLTTFIGESGEPVRR